MEIKDLESLWSDMDRELKKQKELTNTLIMEMTQQKYTNKFQRLSIFETTGGIVCFVAGIYISVQFSSLDTWYLQLCGAITVLVLFLLPILTLRAMKRVQNLDISDSPITETLIRYTKAKDRLLFLQRLGIYMSFLLMLTILPVASKISNGQDLFLETSAWYIYLPLMTVFLFFFARWGYSCYKRITLSAENVLKELE